MVSDVINNLNKKRYRQGKDLKIGRDILTPCLKECKRYRRCTGTYGSSAFKNYLGALGDIVKEGTVIEILTSMNNIAKDSTLFSALKGTKDEKGRNDVLQKHCNDIALIVAGCQTTADSSNREYFQKLIAYLIANNQLIIKFALPLNDELTSEDFWNEEDIKQRAMYHFKYGYFVFPDDSILAFDGSVNETDTALFHSGEMITLHKDWVDGQKEDAEQIKAFVDDDWGETNDNFRIFKISDKTLEIIKKYSSDKRPKNPNEPSNPEPPLAPPKPLEVPYPSPGTDGWKWRHQFDALNEFIKVKSGILEMATGTGKTRTALRIAKYLFEHNEIDQLIITCFGKDLLNQWEDEVIKNDLVIDRFLKRVLNYNKDSSSIMKFVNNPKHSSLILSLNSVHKVLKQLDSQTKKRTFIIYDEVHDIGSETRIDNIKGLNKEIIFKLGLSATPDRGEFDDEGNKFLFSELGSKNYEPFFQFNIKDAIEREILVEFDYIPLEYELTDDDKKEKRSIFNQREKKRKEGNPMSLEEFRRKLSRVNKLSESKLELFENYLKGNPSILKSTIIFVAEEDYGEKVVDILHKYTNRFSYYYGGAKEEILKDFVNEKVDILITCKKLSQGIDISNLRNVVIFASDRKLLETVQRVGRCLRFDPNNINKRAKVIDFIITGTIDAGNDKEEKSDSIRYNWLMDASSVKKLHD